MHRFQLFYGLVSSAFLALTFAGCATDTQPTGDTGGLALDIVLAEGVQIDEVDWTITGGDMEPMSGTIDTSAPGATASVEVFGLPPGTGYAVELEATTTDGMITCGGSTPFDVSIGVATEVMVMLNCKLPDRLGGVRVNGKFNVCAELTKAILSPRQTSIGNTINLSAEATDVEGDAIAYVWSATGGTIANPNFSQTTFTCGEVGPQQITITVSDDEFQFCMHDLTMPITCVEGDASLCEGVDCDDENECTDDSCNPATGECSNEPVADGTSCDGGAGVCDAGACVPADLCEGVDCDDQNECTTDACDPADGSCSNTPVADGTSCNGGAGMCVEGTCVETDLCEGVECDDTGNECTTAMCNMQTGECEVMNVPDGTSCNGGAGACSGGECIADSLCDGVDCTSTAECVQDGTCDPATGECIAGNNVPANVACTENGGTVCDGQGNCVECNNAGQCPEDGNQCTAATCDANACGQTNLMDGASCDFNGGAGVCEAGTCVEAPECVVDADCDDDNVCTIDACSSGTCIYEGLNSGSCEVSPGVPGECSAGVCEPAADPVIGAGSGTTSWNAVPRVSQAGTCTYDVTNTVCTGCQDQSPVALQPGGGQCAQFGAQVFGGCEVPGGVLNAQLAIDTTISIGISSTGDGNITHDITVSASNPALGTAAGLVTVDAASLFASVTSGVPAQLQNDLNSAFEGRLLGEFTLGGNTLTLDNNAATGIGVEIPTVTTAVTPTSSPSVEFDYDNFSLTLTIVASGTPLIVDDAGCDFNQPGSPITLPVQ